MNDRIWGADADELDFLAGHFGDSARRVDAMTRRLSALLRSAPWEGRAADHFRADWSRTHVPHLRHASTFLSEGERRLHDQARQQRAASDGGGSASGFTAMSSGASATESRLSRLLRSLPLVQDGWTLVSGPVGLLSLVTTGRYTDTWRRANAMLGTFANYKSSSLLTSLNQSELYRQLHRGATAIDGAPVFSAIGTGMSLLSIGQHGYAGAQAAAQGDVGTALTESSALVSSGLKSSKNPVAYLGGVGLAIWTDVAVEATKIDYSTALPNPLSGDNFTSMYVPAVTDAVKEVFGAKRLMGWFL